MSKNVKCINWAIVATIERSDGSYYTDTIIETDDDTASTVDDYLTKYYEEEK